MTQAQRASSATAVAVRAIGVIFAVVLLFHAIHKAEFLAPAITFIVGAHVISLARLFRCPMHYVTGTLLMSWATFMAMVFPGAMMPTVGALGTAVILLGSAAYSLTSTGRVARMGSDRRISSAGNAMQGLGTRA